MKSQTLKNIAHAMISPLSVLNRYRIKWLSPNTLKSRRPDGLVWVHLGCGDKYIQGMINVDVNPFTRCDLWMDLRRTLPFQTDSVDAIYCCHTLEHFWETDVRNILKECRRILKPGGAIRIVTPDLEKAAKAYLAKDESHFSDFPDKRRSTGGRFANYLLCRDQHRMIFDFSFWKELLEDSDFQEIKESRPHQSNIFPKDELETFEYEKPDRHHSVFVEGRKP